jgi:hypothetical protein
MFTVMGMLLWSEPPAPRRVVRRADDERQPAINQLLRDAAA